MAIFGLLSTLSAQVICRPVDAKDAFEWSSLDSKKVAFTDNDPPSRNYLVTDYSSQPVRCFEHVGGTIALNNGKVVHSAWVEVKPLERWMSDASSCSASQSKEPLFRFVNGIFERQEHEPARRSISIPVEFCREPIHRPLATDNWF
jgi:hypothetical protein